MDMLSLLNNLDEKTFCIKYSGMTYKKKELIDLIEKFTSNLNGVADFKDKRVFLDINDRLTFIVAFFSLLKLGAKIVLVPTEIKREDFLSINGIFLSDNKDFSNGIMISHGNHFTIGNSFESSIIESSLDVQSNVLFYLYTSGSTGVAKLIPKSAANILVELEELKKILRCNKNDTFFFTPPIYHIYGILFGFFLPFYCSATIFLDYLFTPESIVEFIDKNDISFFVSIPTYYKMFSELTLFSAFKRCKSLISSSAPLPVDVSKKFFENGISIIEIYGSTETGGIAHRISAIDLNWQLCSYVTVVDDWDDYLDTDKDKKVVELKIVSPAISVEYDFSSGFNTGDVVEVQKDGKFTLLGRNTRFIKVSGKRVDLNYVASKIILSIEEDIRKRVSEDEIFVGVKDSVIYAIINNIVNIDVKSIKKILKKHLPSYAMPKVLLNRTIPKNSMGKINKVEIDKIVDEEIKK